MPGAHVLTIGQNPGRRMRDKRRASGYTSLARVCDGLLYQHGTGTDDWRPFPEWARFLIELGALASTEVEEGQRAVAAVIVPTRAYAAAFLSVGTILAYASFAFRPTNAMQHGQLLCSLPLGTAVTYCRGNRRLKGRLLGCEKVNGELRVKVQVEDKATGGLTYLVASKDWASIQLSATGCATLPGHQEGREIATSALVAAMLDVSAARRFLMEQRVDCILIGEKKTIYDEIAHRRIGFCTKDAGIVFGTLQDILRVRRFLSPSDGCRSEVIPVDTTGSGALSRKEEPAAVIFDGSRAYLKWHNRWPKPHCMVVLDRTSPTFYDAVRELNQSFVERRSGNEWTEKRLPPVPVGLEVMVYEEARR